MNTPELSKLIKETVEHLAKSSESKRQFDVQIEMMTLRLREFLQLASAEKLDQPRMEQVRLEASTFLDTAFDIVQSSVEGRAQTLQRIKDLENKLKR